MRNSRLEKKLGLSDIAEACGCSVQFISNIEHGRAPLPWDKVPMLAKVLKLPLGEVQAANLSIRADFKGLTAPAGGKRVAKPAVLKNLSSTLVLASQDEMLQKVLEKYQLASTGVRKELLKAADEMLE